MSVYTTKELLEILPHRQPMLLIDTLEELEPGKRAVGKKCVSYNEPYFDAGSGNDPPERAPWSWKSYGYGGWKDSGDSRADLCHWIRRIPCFRKY